MNLVNFRQIKFSTIALAAFMVVLTNFSEPAQANQPTGGNVGRTSINSMGEQFVRQNPEVSWLRTPETLDANGNPLPGMVNPAVLPGANALGSLNPPTLATLMTFKTPTRTNQEMYNSGITQLNGYSGQPNSDLTAYAQQLQAGDYLARMLQYPPNVANQAKAQALGQAQTMSNAMGDIAKSQSASAISYCSGYLQNFTADEGNRWNKIRNELFVPIALLLLLPGAILTQVKVIAAAGNPVLNAQGQVDLNPFEGILRSVVAIFLIPTTYLVVNYGIDFSNSITYSFANAYNNLMNSNMYQDALSSEVRAFPVRNPKENQNSGQPTPWPTSQIKSIADFEKNYISNKVEDPSTGLNQVPADKTDEAMPSGAVAARELSFGANAALTAGWNVLCAFQMAYLAYLFFVGPIVAALWVWPVDQFRQALPSWVEGVLTLCFWSLFWNTAILLMACFKGVDQNGTIITSALNFLALSSVKYAFDFAGLVKEAGQQVAKQATDKNGSANGGKGSSGAAGKAGARSSAGQQAGAGGNPAGVPGAGGSGAGAGVGAGAEGVGAAGSPNPSTNAPASLATTSAPMSRNELAGAPGPGAAGAGAGGPDQSGDGLANVAMPPLAFAPRTGANDVQVQSVKLGNYSLSQGVGERGETVGLLRDARGNVVAHLPADMRSGQSITASDGSTLTYNQGDQGDSFSLTNTSGQTFASQISMLNAGANPHPGQPAAPGMIDPTGARRNDSIALRSSQGTLLLENNGNTLLIPRPDGKGYDSYQGANSPVSFELPDHRSLAISSDPNGARHIALTSGQNGGSENFVIMPNTTGGYDINRSVNGDSGLWTQVRADGGATHYYNYAANGHVSDIDSVLNNNVSSTYFDLNSGLLLGTAVTNYEDNGSATSYHDANGAVTASTANFYRDGGSYEIVRDANGQMVSSQETTAITNGGYMVQLSKYEAGLVSSSRTNTYDSSSKLISQTPVNYHRDSVDMHVADGAASAEREFQLVASLLNGGKAHQAQQLLNVVTQDVAKIKGSPDAQRLIDKYVQLMARHEMYPQLQTFEAMRMA